MRFKKQEEGGKIVNSNSESPKFWNLNFSHYTIVSSACDYSVLPLKFIDEVMGTSQVIFSAEIDLFVSRYLLTKHPKVKAQSRITRTKTLQHHKFLVLVVKHKQTEQHYLTILKITIIVSIRQSYYSFEVH